MFVGNDRPKTAAMQMGTGLLRPPTGIPTYGKRAANNMTAGGIYG